MKISIIQDKDLKPILMYYLINYIIITTGEVGFEPTTRILEIPIITNLTTLLYHIFIYNNY